MSERLPISITLERPETDLHDSWPHAGWSRPPDQLVLRAVAVDPDTGVAYEYVVNNAAGHLQTRVPTQEEDDRARAFKDGLDRQRSRQCRAPCCEPGPAPSPPGFAEWQREQRRRERLRRSFEPGPVPGSLL